MQYIAYGSNMSREQMAYRCPEARLLDTGYISGARLEFYRHADGLDVAEIVRTYHKRIFDGHVRNIDEASRLVVLADGPSIPIDDLFSISLI